MRIKYIHKNFLGCKLMIMKWHVNAAIHRESYFPKYHKNIKILEIFYIRIIEKQMILIMEKDFKESAKLYE